MATGNPQSRPQAGHRSPFGPQFAGGRADAGSGQADAREIEEASLAGLQQIGWDITGFSAKTVAVEGGYARVTITSTHPPGSFTAFLRQQAGTWTVVLHGSAYNPDELKTLGLPDSVLP